MSKEVPNQSAKAFPVGLGLTQKWFAAKVGVAVPTVDRW